MYVCLYIYIYTYIHVFLFQSNDNTQNICHINWCYLCNIENKHVLKKCTRCCLSFHSKCDDNDTPSVGCNFFLTYLFYSLRFYSLHDV